MSKPNLEPEHIEQECAGEKSRWHEESDLVLFAEFDCGTRYYFDNGSLSPETCPREGCQAEKRGVYCDV